MWGIGAGAENKPEVGDEEGRWSSAAEQEKAGYWVRMSINPDAYINVNGGVACGLLNVMLVKTEEPFGNASRAEDDFSAFFSQAAGEAPSAEVSSEGSVDSMFA